MRDNVDVRFVFTPPADHAAGLLTLPWSVPLASWQDDRLVQIRQRGISRHVVRFVYDDGTLYALKELNEWLGPRQDPRRPGDGQRKYDLERGIERVAGELLDLQSGGLLSFDIDPFEIADELGKRYESLWQELTREEILRPEDQRRQIAERLHRLNKLGFDADEVELIPTPDGNKLRVRTRVPGN